MGGDGGGEGSVVVVIDVIAAADGAGGGSGCGDGDAVSGAWQAARNKGPRRVAAVSVKGRAEGCWEGRESGEAERRVLR